MNSQATKHGGIFVFAFITCAGLSGCQSDPAIPQMEAEMRWVEDQYYALEDAYTEKCKQLASCRMENQALRNGRPVDAVTEGEVVPSGDPTRVLPDVDDTLPEPDGTGDDDDGVEFKPPVIEGGPPLPGTEGDPAPLQPFQGDGESDDAFDSLFSTQNSSARRVFNDVADPEVTHIVLNRRLTGGYDFDQKPGHEGLLVVVEPRNSAGQYVPLAGSLAIVLVDPALPREQSRIARWDLTKQQSGARMRKSLLGRGMHIELPWPGAPPQHKELRLYVRYTTSDGRELKTDQTIEIEPIRELAQRWTPAAGRQERTAARPPVNTLRPRVTNPPTITAGGSSLEAPNGQLPPPVSHQNSTPVNNTANGQPQWQPYR